MNRVSIIICGSFFLGLLSCGSFEKRLDFEQDELPTSIVVQGFIQTGESTTVRLTESRGILDDSFEYDLIENCTVELFEDGTLVNTITESSSDGSFELPHEISSEKNYELRVTHESLPSISALTRAPSMVNELSALAELDDDRIVVKASFDDVEDAEYYQILLYESGFDYPISWSTTSQYFEIDPFEGESYFSDEAFFTHDAFVNGRAEIEMKLENYFVSDPANLNLNVRIVSMSEDLYLYSRSRIAFFNADNGGLFSQPVQIYSNVEQGLGIWGGYSTAEVPVEL